MVVDDDEPIRRLVARILEKEGYEIVVFPDPAPALEDADLDAIQLILTDLNMPTAGEQFIQEVRKRNADTPIVVMSGHLTAEKWRLLEELGVQASLQKPFELPALLQTVRDQLRGRGEKVHE